jgi:nicotinamidase-related amidase
MRDASFGGLFGAPIEGLRPRITEPVFMRNGLSAFSEPAFDAQIRQAGGDDVFLIGFSLADTYLATALSAVDAGLSLILVEDAVGVSGGAPPPAPEIARALLGPLVRTVSSGDIQHGAQEFAR